MINVFITFTSASTIMMFLLSTNTNEALSLAITLFVAIGVMVYIRFGYLLFLIIKGEQNNE